MEKKQPMPVFDQIQIFANHMGARIIQKDGSDSGIIHGVFENMVIYQSGKDPNVKNPFPQVELHLLSIELKPLWRMLYQDKVLLAEACGISPAAIPQWCNKVVLLAINDINDAKEMPVSEWLCAIDVIRERGYALPYKNWSVEQLVEFGIYKIINDGK